ncbi:hypothetical protein [Mangrovibacterium marinum]|uniref:ABC-2 type transport system permease protein n=1 Tax=Mangrovibacterium marinum TaxID=1639118 RepID=A0A2T5BZF5_9BACT|nr:hypothetical protein [Mangrovibacterium marinum]PTN07663.1 hypothetical protein C8N47_1146 [Mangrovibacterium marinum]
MEKRKIKNTTNLIASMIKYNFRIIFAGRFIWFLLAALAFYIFIAIMGVINGATPDEEFVYGILLFPAILLIFYPMTFGIQNDVDAGILEILFGIPDYRYKVWLVRLVLVFVLIALILYGFSLLSYVFLAPINRVEMTGQIMFPVLFLGSMAFMFSTIIKNGNGTAVVMVILGVLALFLQNVTERTMWNIFLNPFNVPRNMSEVVWEGIALKNRIFLTTGAVVFILYGLFNLQKREKFI